MSRILRPKILVTGGTGYIGSHTCVSLIESGFEPVILDNLCNSSEVVLDRIAAITKHRPVFCKADIRDSDALDRVLGEHTIDAVIHFAGLKAVGGSLLKPLDYYFNNVGGSLRLFDALQRAGIRKLIFSSSATVYGTPDEVPIRESAPLRPGSPYGQTKAIIERILGDMYRADHSWRIGILRYFNPVGAHESGLIGEDPRGDPENLVPFIAQVAVGRYEKLRIFGNDYPTPDGTGIRDYVHVMDLAEGHMAALGRLRINNGIFTVNLGTGKGYSVLEVIAEFEKASGQSVSYQWTARRPGDIAMCYADVTLSTRLLGWSARRDLEQMCVDAWRWQLSNPDGYAAKLAPDKNGKAILDVAEN